MQFNVYMGFLQIICFFINFNCELLLNVKVIAKMLGKTSVQVVSLIYIYTYIVNSCNVVYFI